MSDVHVTYKVDDIDFSGISEEQIVSFVATKVDKAFIEFGPHMVKAAQNFAPQSAERDFNPRVFRALKLRSLGSLGSVRTNERASRLADLHGLDWRSRAKVVNTLKDADLFQGTGSNEGKTPDLIERQGGTIKGAFRHQPGTLKKSIRFEGIRHDGNAVRAIVRAHAPYAKAVHDGFTHKGGTKHTGRGTFIKGKPFLRWALINIRDRLKNPASYGG